jgi:alpha-galactosidase
LEQLGTSKAPRALSPWSSTAGWGTKKTLPQNIGGCAYANASSALNAANAFVSLGLKDLGYTYVNMDDCWPSKTRNASGYLVPDPSKWPNGMKPVADQIHNLGLKMGLYGDSGTETCAGYPGSIGYETKDAAVLAAWGIDYWKYDDCYTTSATNSEPRFAAMRDALLRCGRTILYSMCGPYDNQAPWASTVGNSWRMHPDIADAWSSVASIAATAAGLSQYAGPGGFNDLDMMASSPLHRFLLVSPY